MQFNLTYSLISLSFHNVIYVAINMPLLLFSETNMHVQMESHYLNYIGRHKRNAQKQ